MTAYENNSRAVEEHGKPTEDEDASHPAFSNPAEAPDFDWNETLFRLADLGAPEPSNEAWAVRITIRWANNGEDTFERPTDGSPYRVSHADREEQG
jgi:hypothetical protein